MRKESTWVSDLSKEDVLCIKMLYGMVSKAIWRVLTSMADEKLNRMLSVTLRYGDTRGLFLDHSPRLHRIV